MTALLMAAFIPSYATAGTDTPVATVSPTSTPVSAEAQALLSRLDEIKAMDMSDLNSVQKRQLRKEVRSIKDALNQMDGKYIYVSAGALIVILLLVILLL